MSEALLFDTLLIGMPSLGAVIFISLFFFTAPYGRHGKGGWGPEIPSRLGWVIMEAPAWLIVAGLFAFGGAHQNAMGWIFLGMWSLHYFYRAFIYPLRRRDDGRRMPLSIALAGLTFNFVNGYLQGRGLFHFGEVRDLTWLVDPRFIAGAALFFTGYAINHHADATLRSLRRPGESGYKIPRGGLYRWISCPNYFGEIIEWIGWAIAIWHPVGAVFVFWTIANLAPRARAHHRWYQEKFPDYPAQRRALLPLLW